MGGRWDIKLGKNADSFFKFVTLVEVSKSTDLHANVRFSESKFLFCNEYRQTCKGVILGKKKNYPTWKKRIIQKTGVITVG